MSDKNTKNLNFVFFGGEPLSVATLEKLYENGFTPQLIVCNPDKPAGRNLEITAPPTKIWAEKHNIDTLQSEKFDKNFIGKLKSLKPELGIVVSYGKIIPKEIVELPTLGLINIHPSLLPMYRGPSPIVAPILNGDAQTGVTIIKIDEGMDHGPILAQEKINLHGNEFIEDLEKSLAVLGRELLVKTIPDYIGNNTNPCEQNHEQATYVKKIVKADGEIKLENDRTENWRKFRAYHSWPRTFFFQNNKRIIITDAVLENNQFVIKKVIPEGKKEIKYEDFLKTNTLK